MSQPTSKSSTGSKAGVVPVQLSLFVGEFDVTGQALASGQDSAGLLTGGLKLAGVEPAVTRTESLSSQAIEFMQIFEAVSGWEVRFQESTISKNQKLVSADQPLQPQGKFEIIDMSIDWPAKTPAMHRGKCDQLLKLYSDLYNQANATQDSFDKVQGLLSALTDPVEGTDQLVDSFAPTYTNLVEGKDQDLDFAMEQGSDFDEPFDSAFVVKQEFDSNFLCDESVWADWSFAGATGIVGDAYLDWEQRGDTLTAFVGRLESSFGVGDTESSLEVNAVSRQFKVNEENTLAAFFFWDRRGGRLQSVAPGSWQTLYSQGAIIVSTDPNVEMPESVVNAQLGAEPFTAEQLAMAIEAKLGADHRVLVIKCG